MMQHRNRMLKLQLSNQSKHHITCPLNWSPLMFRRGLTVLTPNIMIKPQNIHQHNSKISSCRPLAVSISNRGGRLQTEVNYCLLMITAWLHLLLVVFTYYCWSLVPYDIQMLTMGMPPL